MSPFLVPSFPARIFYVCFDLIHNLRHFVATISEMLRDLFFTDNSGNTPKCLFKKRRWISQKAVKFDFNIGIFRWFLITEQRLEILFSKFFTRIFALFSISRSWSSRKISGYIDTVHNNRTFHRSNVP